MRRARVQADWGVSDEEMRDLVNAGALDLIVDTVEAGFMTKDLALLVGDQQGWLTTEGFLDKVAENLKAALPQAA